MPWVNIGTDALGAIPGGSALAGGKNAVAQAVRAGKGIAKVPVAGMKAVKIGGETIEPISKAMLKAGSGGAMYLAARYAHANGVKIANWVLPGSLKITDAFSTGSLIAGSIVNRYQDGHLVRHGQGQGAGHLMTSTEIRLFLLLPPEGFGQDDLGAVASAISGLPAVHEPEQRSLVRTVQLDAGPAVTVEAKEASEITFDGEVFDVTQHTLTAWIWLWHGQPVFSVGVDDFRPADKVPGRRRNRSVVGEHRIRWFFGRILLPIRNTLLNVIGLAVANPPGPGFRRSRVIGPANCMALNLADATRHEHQRLEVEPLWLVWSPSRTALL